MNDLQNVICRFKDNQNRILIKAFNNIQTCDETQLARTKAVGNKMFWYKRLTMFCLITLAVSVVILIFTLIGLWFFQLSNHANKFGGCSVNLFAPFDECPIAF